MMYVEWTTLSQYRETSRVAVDSNCVVLSACCWAYKSVCCLSGFDNSDGRLQTALKIA